MVTVALIVAGLLNGASSAKYISEFTLDELTNADASYQPVNFAAHNLAAKYAAGSQASSGSIDGSPVQQHVPLASRPIPIGNRVQLIGE